MLFLPPTPINIYTDILLICSYIPSKETLSVSSEAPAASRFLGGRVGVNPITYIHTITHTHAHAHAHTHIYIYINSGLLSSTDSSVDASPTG